MSEKLWNQFQTNSLNPESTLEENLTPEQLQVKKEINSLQKELDSINATKKYVNDAWSYLSKKLSPQDYSNPEAIKTIKLLESYKSHFITANERWQNIETSLAELNQNIAKLEDSFEFSTWFDIQEDWSLNKNEFSKEQLKNITNNEFLKLNLDQRLQYVTKNHVDSEKIVSWEIKQIEFTFTYQNSFNKELYMLTTAWQVLPSEVRKVTVSWNTYSRTWISGEFFSKNGERLLIHESTIIEDIKIWDIKELLQENDSKVSSYIEKNEEYKKYEDIVYGAFARWIDPSFAINILSPEIDKLNTVKRNVLIEEIFSQFDRIRWENSNWDGELLDNWRYSDEVAVRLIKEFWWKSWEQKCEYYWIKKTTIQQIETEKFSKFSSIDINNLKPWIKWFLDFIAIWESRWNYNAVYWDANQSRIDFTSYKLWEILAYQKKRISSWKQSAIWKYQFINKTLEWLVRNYNLDINQKFSPEIQDKLAILKLKEIWLDSFLNWKLSRDNFQINVSKEWACLPKNTSWKSYYSWDWLNKALVSNSDFCEALDKLKFTV